jgi:8-oxo-dGTP diphosphatase
MIRAVVGILKREDKVLVGKRPHGKPYGGYWEFPGGKIEPNESGKNALIRELHEELGIDVTSAHSWFEHTHTYPDKTVFLEIWLVEKFSGEPHGKENQSLRWVTLPEVLELQLLEGNWSIMDRIKTLFVEG